MAKGVEVVEVTEQYLKDYLGLNERIKKLNEQLGGMKEVIKAAVEAGGEKTDSGNIILAVGNYEAKLEARTSVSLDQVKAEAVLKRAKVYSDCVEITISDEKVEQAFRAGKLSDSDMEKMTQKKTIHALKVKSA